MPSWYFFISARQAPRKLNVPASDHFLSADRYESAKSIATTLTM